MSLRYYATFAILITLANQICPVRSINNSHPKTKTDQYQENLFIRPLIDGKLFTQFQFKTLYREDIKSLRWENKIQIFPLSMAELISESDVNALHFSLTKGNWDYKNWGYSSRPSPPGAQIRVNFSKHSKTPDKHWKKLIQLLAGKFCASLATADEMTVTLSKLSFVNDILDNSSMAQDTHFVDLPEEAFCTENLTPWKKLLPCYSNSGLASLLNSKNILRSSYSSIAIDIEPKRCFGEGGKIIVGCERVELTQTMTIIFNPLQFFEGKQTWSLTKIFGNPIHKTCSLADSTRIFVDITDLDDKSKLYPSSYDELPIQVAGSLVKRRKFARFNVDQELERSNLSKPFFNMGIKQNQLFKHLPPSKRSKLPIHLRTNIAGMGASDGTIIAKVTNSLSESVMITYMDSLPHFVRVYLHSLIIESQNGEKIKTEKVNFVLSKDGEPTLIEISFVIPANTEVRISYDFERAFLRWTEYKPGANKGYLISSASAVASLCCGCLDHLVMPVNAVSSNASSIGCDNMHEDSNFRLYARPLLLIQPTPDFSMPYNVICLVCSVLVAGFGPIYNMTTRKPILKEKTD